MIALAVLVVVSVVVAVGALVLVWYRSTHGVLATRCRREVLVTLTSGETFRGVLFDADGDALVLRSAVAVGFGGEGNLAPVQGEVVLLRSTVAYMQATGGSG